MDGATCSQGGRDQGWYTAVHRKERPVDCNRSCKRRPKVVVVVVVGLKGTKQLRLYSAQTLSKRAQQELH